MNELSEPIGRTSPRAKKGLSTATETNFLLTLSIWCNSKGNPICNLLTIAGFRKRRQRSGLSLFPIGMRARNRLFVWVRQMTILCHAIKITFRIELFICSWHFRIEAIHRIVSGYINPSNWTCFVRIKHTFRPEWDFIPSISMHSISLTEGINCNEPKLNI